MEVLLSQSIPNF